MNWTIKKELLDKIKEIEEWVCLFAWALCAHNPLSPQEKQTKLTHKERNKKKLKLVDRLGLSLFLASCLWRSALITNHKEKRTPAEEEKKDNPTTHPFLCWLSMLSRKERRVDGRDLPRSFWLLGLGSMALPLRSASSSFQSIPLYSIDWRKEGRSPPPLQPHSTLSTLVFIHSIHDWTS